MPDCKTCKESREVISRQSHEADMDRMERTNKRLFWALMVFVFLFVCALVFHFWYESQFETTTETTSYEVEQDADGNGSNNFYGGDYFYGASEDKGNENNEDP